MNVRKYEAFFKTVRLGSLTRAGDALGLTQSAVSHIIADIEADFGFPLMTRSRNGVRLTPDGEKLLPLMKKIVEAERGLREAVASIRCLEAGPSASAPSPA